MRTLLSAVLLTLSGVQAVDGQQPSPVRSDSLARADSIRIMREIAAMGREAPPPRQAGVSNPRMLPDLSAVGDLIGDFSPKGSTQNDRSRFGVREIEIAVQAAVDPYFRGEIFLGFSDAEGVHIEQAFLTATALPMRLEARLGRFLMPFGKQNTTHRHDLHTVEHSYAVQRFLGEEGLKGTGVYLSRVLAPLGFYQELIVTAVDRFGEADPDHSAAQRPANHRLGDLGFSARLRNYWDLSEASNLELSASGITGVREQPLLETAYDPQRAYTAALARQSVLGLDFTYRWRPLQQGLYRSFILQGEFMRQFNEKSPALPATNPTAEYAGPIRDFSSAYLFARYQLSRRTHIGGRYDWMQDPEEGGVSLSAGTGLLEFFPSEFSKLVAAVERQSVKGLGGTTRFLLQATFAVGPHKPHPF